MEHLKRKRFNLLKNRIGWLASLLIIFAYAGLIFDVFTKTSIVYSLLNLVGGIGLAWRVYQDRNYSTLFLEFVFIIIALYSLLCQN